MSPVLERMLEACEIEPSMLEQAISARIRKRIPNLCEADDLPRTLGLAAGPVVTRLRRKNRYLLVEFNSRRLYYAERNATECWVISPGELPDTAATAAHGRRLGEVIALGSLAALLGSCTIMAAGTAWTGATRFDLEPQWLRFS